MSQQQQTTSLQAIKSPAPREQNLPDLKIDMFSLRGFELACRIGKAFAASDAVPAPFRSHNLKKVSGQETWVENPSALGNCVVAVETAQAVGVSITAVMQNANVIEGRLTWSGKFVIAAVNASHRFTPLRFHMVNKGKMKAKYREKLGWNKDKKGFDFADREVEIENIECTAWAIPFGMAFPPGIATLPQAREVGLPVIEGAPVSMLMAVEEGWYSKPGSKWQTSMRHLMLQYRAGSFFGNIHAPDVVMGMGRTTEEVFDTIDFEEQPDGRHTVDINSLRPALQAGGSEDTDPHTGELHQNSPASPQQETGAAQTGTAAGPAGETSQQADQGQQQDGGGQDDGLSYAKVRDSLENAKDLDVLDVAADLITQVRDPGQQEELRTFYRERKEVLATQPATTGTTTRRAKPQQTYNAE